jgi:archaellin
MAFGRQWSLIAGPAGVVGTSAADWQEQKLAKNQLATSLTTAGSLGHLNSAIEQAPTTLSALSGLEGINLSELRITFNVKKKLGKSDYADIQVYNANQFTRNYLQATGIIGVSLSAGYVDEGVVLLFEGEIRAAPTHQKDDDYITKMQTSDKTITVQSAQSNHTIAANSTILSVVQTILGDINTNAKNIGGPSLGLGNAKQVLTPLPSLWPRDGYICGYAKTSLDNICKSAGLVWTISKGQLLFTDLGYSAGNGNPMQLSAGTGLISSPGNDGKGVFNFETLIIPGIDVNRVVQMDAKYVSGYYRIFEAHYQGDTHGRPWTIKCKALAAKGTPGAVTQQQGSQVAPLGY